jgi:hypothetical protein
MKIVLLLFILGLATTIIEARFEAKSLITQMVIKSTTCTPCCDKCTCAESLPLKCKCEDVKPACHSACKACRCFETLPLKCDCLDITDFCYEPCNSTTIAKPH